MGRPLAISLIVPRIVLKELIYLLSIINGWQRFNQWNSTIAEQRWLMILRLPKRSLVDKRRLAVEHYMILHFPIPLLPRIVNP
jgi:hypothetical protein